MTDSQIQTLVRGASRQQIFSVLDTVWKNGMNDSIIDTVILAFRVRDVRRGAIGEGERDVFYTMVEYIYAKYPDILETVLKMVPEYGSWADMFRMATRYPHMKSTILQIAKAQLLKDEEAVRMGEHRSISLLAKWAPRERKAFDGLAKEFARVLELPSTCYKKNHSNIMASYRKRIAKLNMILETVETLESAGRWDEIRPSSVPRRALKIKRLAYLNENIHCPSSGNLRYPNDMSRMVCRENFLKYFEECEGDEQRRYEEGVDDMRYIPIRHSLKEWFEGGWRAII
jgi:hypothetical protein